MESQLIKDWAERIRIKAGDQAFSNGQKQGVIEAELNKEKGGKTYMNPPKAEFGLVSQCQCYLQKHPHRLLFLQKSQQVH